MIHFHLYVQSIYISTTKLQNNKLATFSKASHLRWSALLQKHPIQDGQPHYQGSLSGIKGIYKLTSK